jgi:S1-C subfamily serine protease
MSFFLPYAVEQVTYSFARGKQRALYETAGEKLRNASLKDMSDACQLVANRVGPSVVHITSTQTAAVSAINDQPRWRHPSTSQGSGVVVDESGYIVTNAHVIQGCTDIRVKLSDGRRVAGTIVGTDPMTDMAVLKVDAGNLIAAEWGDSDGLKVGGLVWALGSPLGLQRSVTFGILSGKNRSFSAEQRYGILDSQGIVPNSPYHNFLQTDAAVNPGNSGGPLVDSQGKVVGINTAIVGEAYQGISFAIPSSTAQPIYERIRSEGRVKRGWLGVDPDDVTPELAKRLGLPNTSGALVRAVVPNQNGQASPAQKAGIIAGDVILRWDGHPIRTSTDLFSYVALTDIGAAVEVAVYRDGQEVTLEVTVDQRPTPTS